MAEKIQESSMEVTWSEIEGRVIMRCEKEGRSRDISTEDGTILCSCDGTFQKIALCLATATTGLLEASKLSPDTRLTAKITEDCARRGQVNLVRKVIKNIN